MKCPYLEEVVVRYCKAFPLKKMIPREAIGQESPCTSGNHCSCSQFRTTAYPEDRPCEPLPAVAESSTHVKETCTQEIPERKEEVAAMAATEVKRAPGKERQCIWTKAGVVSYRLCTHDYDCDACQFNQSLLDTSKQYDEAPEVFDFASKLRDLPADQRKCRYMLMGEVSYKLCPNNYNCGACAFDQDMRYSVEMHPRILARREKTKRVRTRGFFLRKDYYYHPKHTWAKVMVDGTIRIGLDDFAQGLIGKGDGVALPSVGDEVKTGKQAWRITSGNRTAGLVSPISGTVEEINPEIGERTDLINQDPYGKGWIMRIRPHAPVRETDDLALGEDARLWLEDHVERLHSEMKSELGVTVADGGQPLQRAAASMSDEDWQHFVNEFLAE
jgi:glycine cleavage system H lipoate-binding protein